MSADMLDMIEAELRSLLDEMFERCRKCGWGRFLFKDPKVKQLGERLYALGGQEAMIEVANRRIVRPMPWAYPRPVSRAEWRRRGPCRRDVYINIIDMSWNGIGNGADRWRA
jgi:hypothetical protein